MDAINSIRPREIALDINALDKREVLTAVAAACERLQNLHPAPIFRALWRREEAGSTGLGHGVAIPHARIHGLDQALTLFVRTRAPIDFGAPDAKHVSQFFVILVPADRASDEHLELLARIAEMFSDPSLRARLAAARDPAEAQGIFAQWVARRTDDAGATRRGGGERR